MRTMPAKLPLLGGMTALVLLFALGCGPKRPPVVATSPDNAAPSSGSVRPSGSVDEPALDGSDIQALSNDSTAAGDLASADGSGPLADVYFDFDQTALTEEARAALVKDAAWLTAHPQVTVTIEGHCDERGTVEYNLALGDKRAQVVRDQLLALGVAAARLRTVSFGKEQPLDAGHDEPAWARNRRAHFAAAGR